DRRIAFMEPCQTNLCRSSELEFIDELLAQEARQEAAEMAMTSVLGYDPPRVLAYTWIANLHEIR
ncbi:MAG TPA: hypothetical protein VMI06_00620, partial [Terriglobia bacterium]|nr:hypothetical protein [Terriglobia bacterium]